MPEWLRVELPRSETFGQVRRLIRELRLNTVCQSARCPNVFDCFSRGVATFLILGSVCTRGCRFCNIAAGELGPTDPGEPDRIAEAVNRLSISHVVVTSVTRDDLPDGGSGHFVATVTSVRKLCPGVTVEVLIPDFQGRSGPLRDVLSCGPDILNHNVETVPGLYATVRPKAEYRRSLKLLERSRSWAGVRTKSGLMVGLGETDDQIREVIRDLAGVGCEVVTVGQYLRPSMAHAAVERYVEPKVFETYASFGRSLGIPQMHCGPLVRSSYHAAEFLKSNVPA